MCVIRFLLIVKYKTFLFLRSCYLCSAILQFINPSKQVLTLVTCIFKGDPQTAFKLALILQAFNHMWLFITGTYPSLFMICTVVAGSTKGLCKLDHTPFFYLQRVLFICRLFMVPFVDMWNRFTCNTTKALVPPNTFEVGLMQNPVDCEPLSISFQLGLNVGLFMHSNFWPSSSSIKWHGVVSAISSSERF